MFGGGKGMGGGAGSGSMLRLVGRTVATARAAGVTNHPQDPASSPTSASNTSSANSTTSPRAAHKFNPGGSNSLGLSSASGSPFSAHTGNVPVSANNSFCHAWLPPFSGDDYVWVALDGSDEEKPPPPPPPGDGFLLGPVPSSDEVTDAVSALTQVFGASSYSQFVRDKFTYSADKDVADLISSPNGLPHQVLSVGAEFDWPEPSSHLCNPRMLCSYGSDRVYDAFHLLQTEPSVQRMVISLSSDEAVWDAVLNNEVVRQLRETYYAEEKLSPPSPESSDETHDNSNPAMDIIRWIFDNTRAKFVEVFEKITNLVNQLFKPPNDEKTARATSPFEERIRTSFLLSIVVLLVVVLTRAQRA